MKKKTPFTPTISPSKIGTALVPIVHGCACESALAAARRLAREVVIVGLVKIAEGEAVSAGARPARQMREYLRQLASSDKAHLRIKARVRVSQTPWEDVLTIIAADQPDLLVLEWEGHLSALGITPAEVLTRPPCDVALIRGPFPASPTRALVTVRGGPHAELALRLGLSLHADELTALHLQLEKDSGTDAPFRGLAQVLKRLPEVHTRTILTPDPARTIVEESQAFDVVVLGATAQPMTSPASLGPMADRVLRESPSAVIVVKTRRPMPITAPDDETIGAQAISILVDKWFAENTFHADEFADLQQLVALKQAQRLSLSLALPALNEEKTVGHVLHTVKRALMDDLPLLDEIVLIDSNSTDRTRDLAAELGVPVFIHQHLLPELGVRRGKGEALWKSLLVTRGDLVAWIDTDVVNIHPRFVYGILGPLLLNPQIQFVKGFYRRPLKVGEKTQAGGGGRVTELTARPLLNLFYPELSGVIQPLSGEYAGRRRALEQVPFFSGYGVETGLLIDMFDQHGLPAIAQVDLLERIHHNQPLEALSKMSFAIIQAVIYKLERRYGRAMLEDINKSMKLIRHGPGGYFLDVEELAERERPPMLDLPEYQTRRATHPLRRFASASQV